MYFSNLDKKKEIKKVLNQKGICVAKNFLNKKKILKIRNKVKKKLNDFKALKAPRDIKKTNENNIKLNRSKWLPKKYQQAYREDQFKQPTGDISYKVSQKILRKGFKFYSKFTNSVELKDPLIQIKEINEIIFNKKIYDIAKVFLNEEPFLGYIALRCHFKNNLPDTDFQFFHTDSRNKITLKKDELLKFLIPFNLEKNEKNEFSQIIYKRNKIKNDDFYKLQYSKYSELPKYLKKKLISPLVKNGDGYFFDPENFFHNAKKPKKLRIILYLVFVKKNNYMISKTKKIKIREKDYIKLNILQKRFVKFLKKI
tara:strand:+ start:1019 stop:1954 length:936 start_codon:yes stop_codon:yes gene_type:complete